MAADKQGDKKGSRLFKNSNLERNQKFLSVLYASLKLWNNFSLWGQSGLQYSKRVQFMEIPHLYQRQKSAILDLSIFFYFELTVVTDDDVDIAFWLVDKTTCRAPAFFLWLAHTNYTWHDRSLSSAAWYET